MKITTMLLKASGYIFLVFFNVSSITILIYLGVQIANILNLNLERYSGIFQKQYYAYKNV